MKKLCFVEELVPLVLSGEKDTTWRIFDDKNLSEKDELLFLESKTRTPFAKARITSVKETTLDLKNLSVDDRKGHEQYKDTQEMINSFSDYYDSTITKDTVLKIIKFELVQKINQ